MRRGYARVTAVPLALTISIDPPCPTVSSSRSMRRLFDIFLHRHVLGAAKFFLLGGRPAADDVADAGE